MTTPADTSPAEGNVLVGTLFRERRLSVKFTTTPPAAPLPTARRPAQVARLLALAHHLQRTIDRGAVADRADLAERLQFTRARITQLLDLLLLAPDIQDAILSLEAFDGVEPLSERALRSITHLPSWVDQRTLWSTASSSRLPDRA